MTRLNKFAILRRESTLKGRSWKHRYLFEILKDYDFWNDICSRVGSFFGENIFIKSHVGEILSLRQLILQQVYKSNLGASSFDSLNKVDSLVFRDVSTCQVIYVFLNNIFSPLLYRSSFGVKSNSGPHDALRFLEKNFSDSHYLFTLSIKNIPHVIDRNLLFRVLDRNIDDKLFINLLYAVFPAKFFDFSSFIFRFEPVRSLVSLLLGIYFYDLDFWLDYKVRFLFILESEDYSRDLTRLLYLFDGWEGVFPECCSAFFTSESNFVEVPLEIINFYPKRRVCYLRYLDQLLLGFTGEVFSRSLVTVEVLYFLETFYKVSSQSILIDVTNQLAQGTFFLGYKLFIKQHSIAAKVNKLCLSEHFVIRFLLPLELALSCLKRLGFITKNSKGFYPTSKKSYLRLKETVILRRFSTLWFNIRSYYLGLSSLSCLKFLHYLVLTSCVMTIAQRRKSSCNSIFNEWTQNDLREFSKRNSLSTLLPHSFKVVKAFCWIKGGIFHDPFEKFSSVPLDG